MKYLQLQNIPRWYDVKFDPVKPAFNVHVRKDVAENLPLFKEVITQEEMCEDVVYYVPLPKFLIITDVPCKKCFGTLENTCGNDCLECCSTGKELQRDWNSIGKMSLSLAQLLEMLMKEPEQEIYSSRLQLCSYGLYISKDSNGLFGTFSPYMCKLLNRPLYLESYGDIVKEAMLSAWSHMMVLNDYDTSHVGLSAYPRHLAITCPGHGCGITTVDVQKTIGNRGCTFIDHNIVNPMQALTLLAGLSTLMSLINADASMVMSGLDHVTA